MPFLYQLTNTRICAISGHLNDGEIAIAHIARAHAIEIAKQQAREIVRCYISPEILGEMAKMNQRTVADQFAELIPDQPHLMAGDIGEMLMRQYLGECPQGFSVPVYRWRNRSTKNDTVRGTDLIGYCNYSHIPSPQDLLVMCEVKTRSATVNPEVVADALAGAQEDYASRLANSIAFSQARLLYDGLKNESAALARFRRPHSTPYRKRIIGAVVHDAAKWDDDFLKHLPAAHGLPIEVGITILKVEDLATWISELFTEATIQAENA